MIKMIKSWIEFDRAMKQMRSVLPRQKRSDRKKIEKLSIRLLQWHIMRGETITEIETMLSESNAQGDSLPPGKEPNGH